MRTLEVVMRHDLPSELKDHPGMRWSYRPNVAAVVLNDRDQILWCERVERPGLWQFPQGGIDPGEEADEALWRELSEELGLAQPREVLRIVDRLRETLSYDFTPEIIGRFLHREGHSYLGQSQQFFLLRFDGSDAQLTLMPPPGMVREFASFRWGDASFWTQAPEFKQAVISRALRGFGLL